MILIVSEWLALSRDLCALVLSLSDVEFWVEIFEMCK